jgi:Tol biopolymer transport system component
VYYVRRASKMLELAATPDVRGGRLTLLASSENLAGDPALSADGKMLAYVAEDQGQVDLFVSRVAGGARVRLTNDEGREATPHISPDGERIVYTRYGLDAPASEVRLVPTLGGPSVRLIANAADAVWSPDGQRIAFISRRPGEGDTLATIAADGADFRIVLRHDAIYPFFRSPAWSPDGTKLAVVRSMGGISGELWLIPMNGGSPRRLSNDGPAVFSLQPVFTADGRGIIHQSNRAGAPNLWVLTVDTGRLGRLTTGPGPDESPSVARDGSVAFANPRFRSKLFVYDLGTGQTRELAAHSSFIWAPAFSPDGREVAFSRAEMDGSWHIWIAPVQGDTVRRLTSGAIPEIYSRFSPDGAAVIYHTWSPGHGRIWMEPRWGGPAVALTPVRDDDDSYGDISPDGRWLAFARTEKENTRIYVMPIKGGEAKRLTESASTLPRWSPDGRWIAFSPSRGMSGGVCVMGADGSGVRRLTETGSWPVWWPDGKRIGYMNIGPTGSQQFLTVSLEGGPPKPLVGLHVTGSNNPFDVSPDGKLLASSDSVRLSSQIWLLK